VGVLEAMLQAGMVAARIDLTWGGLDFHRATLAALNVSGTMALLLLLLLLPCCQILFQADTKMLATAGEQQQLQQQ
jgi:hypothetical protein